MHLLSLSLFDIAGQTKSDEMNVACINLFPMRLLLLPTFRQATLA